MIRIGISGWRYPPWRRVFYPPGLPQRLELAYAAERFGSVEINGTFYSIQRPSSFRRWAAETPADFVFAVKGGRFLTHMKKLSEVEVPLANFFASGVLALGAKLGPILWQLPPNLGFGVERLTAFFNLLPRTAGAAAALAQQHDARLSEDQTVTTSELPDWPLRYGLEVRHRSFYDPGVPELLREHDIATVVGDNPGKWPILEHNTSDFRYVRLHGDTELYTSGYTDDALDRWAAKIRTWSDDGQDVFVYCDNDAKVRAPYDALGLMERLGLRRGPTET